MVKDDIVILSGNYNIFFSNLLLQDSEAAAITSRVFDSKITRRTKTNYYGEKTKIEKSFRSYEFYKFLL